jgi:hypothetical protein
MRWLWRSVKGLLWWRRSVVAVMTADDVHWAIQTAFVDCLEPKHVRVTDAIERGSIVRDIDGTACDLLVHPGDWAAIVDEVTRVNPEFEFAGTIWGLPVIPDA